MVNLFRDRSNCFCAFCKSPRRIYRKKTVSAVDILASAVAAGVLMGVVWQGFDARVIVVFVVFLSLSEIFVRLRWRLSLACSQCGFDPVLYLRRPLQAADKVKKHLEKRKEDPQYLLAKPLNLPVLSAEQAKLAQAKEKRGTLVSRQI